MHYGILTGYRSVIFYVKVKLDINQGGKNLTSDIKQVLIIYL
nr:MAG TPA: hypothetical protein [Caudoviricetes sp.]